MLVLTLVTFRGLLAFCPPGFRREYGDAILRDFRDGLREAGGPGARAAYAARTALDLLATAFQEYLVMLLRDLVFAWRSLRRTPGFTAIVVLTLAVAIGANASIYSILRAVVFAPLPYPGADRLVVLRAGREHFTDLSLPDFHDVVVQSAGVFDGASAFAPNIVTLTGRGAPRRIEGTLETPGLLELLGARPQRGRFLTAADGVKGAPLSVVISDELWRSAFDGDPSAIGAVAMLDGDAYRVVGIAPPDFVMPKVGSLPGLEASAFWTAIAEDGRGTTYAQRGYHEFPAIARLARGATPESAAALLAVVSQRLHARYPKEDVELALDATSLTDAIVGKIRGLLFAVFAAVGGVLLVACANVANLLLSRASTRDREIAVRVAVGASRGRVIAQFLVETSVLALAGAAFGVAIAIGITHAFVAIHPPGVPRIDRVAVDGGALLFTFGIALCSAFAAGIAPAVAASSRDVAAALKRAGRGGDASAGARARSALVTIEIALTLALVVAAGLVVKSYTTLTTQPLGFEPGGVAVVGPFTLPDRRYATDAARVSFYSTLLAEARAVPGAESVAVAYSAPFTGRRLGLDFAIVGRPEPRPEDVPQSQFDIVSDGWPHALAIPVLEGRDLTPDDRLRSQLVALVNESFQRKFFPNGDAIGHDLVSGIYSDLYKTSPKVRIVGVIADARPSYAGAADPTVFLAMSQSPIGDGLLIVRSAPGSNAASTIAELVRAHDPLLPRPRLRMLSDYAGEALATARLTVAALTTLAVISLILAIAGIFAVVSYGVAQRTHEFGVRMALGASGARIVAGVVGRAMRVAAVGIALGLVAAALAGRLVRDQLFQTEPLDPATFAVVTVLVAGAAVVAAYLPARRLTRLDPAVALRYE